MEISEIFWFDFLTRFHYLWSIDQSQNCLKKRWLTISENKYYWNEIFLEYSYISNIELLVKEKKRLVTIGPI